MDTPAFRARPCDRSLGQDFFLLAVAPSKLLGAPPGLRLCTGPGEAPHGEEVGIDFETQFIYLCEEVKHMPGFDRTGPAGQGPMTGGARGVCNPSTASRPYGVARPRTRFFPRVFGAARPRGGRGFRGRGGRGRGRR